MRSGQLRGRLAVLGVEDLHRAVREHARSSPRMCAALTAGRAAVWRALAAPRAVPKCHLPCRKCPSTPLIRGSPLAVTVDRAGREMFITEADHTAVALEKRGPNGGTR
ncbi:hypothetical protein [Actinomadura sp. GTD37]|uniref:hypothetical protein n=1 Tax=Actinomadura sp. GTD37 TaxID=1778030 RepID=UPI0035C10DBE